MESNNSKNANNPLSQFSRALKIKNKVFPPSTESVIIVKANDEGLGYRFDCYSPCLEGRCPRNLFDSTVKRANKICENIWKEKRLNEKAKVLPAANFIFHCAIFICLIGIILLTIFMFFKEEESILVSSFILIWISGGMVAFVSIYCFLKQETNKSIEQRIVEEVGKYLEKENEIYNNFNLKWTLESEAFWMELRIMNKA
jgi:hypothetical protein